MAGKYDLLIRKGMVVTGSGMRKADVGIKGEKIVAVKPPRRGFQVIDLEVCDAGSDRRSCPSRL
jgi:dihydroorotase-like cyclic amidohydrolase